MTGLSWRFTCGSLLVLAACKKPPPPTAQLVCEVHQGTATSSRAEAEAGSGPSIATIATWWWSSTTSRSVVPRSGTLRVRVVTPEGEGKAGVIVKVAGRVAAGHVPRGRPTQLALSVSLEGLPPGPHPVEVSIDGQDVLVPGIEVAP